MKNKLRALGLLGILGVAGKGYSLPLMDEPHAISKIANGEYSEVTVLKDMNYEENRKVYLPYDKIEFVKDEAGRPKFSFTYIKGSGGTLIFSVTAGYSNETQETIASLEDHGDEVAPLPISNGNWVFSTAGTDWAPKSSSSKGLWQPMATVFPGIPVAIQLELTEKEAIRYAANLKGNGGIAVNYSYTFEGAKTPRTMTAEINYNSVANFFNEIDDDLSKSCSVDKPSSRDSITECDIDRHVIHTLTESLVQEGVVKMTCFDCEDEQKDTVNELTQLIVAKMFQPAEWESDPASIRTNPKPADCVIENHGCYRLDCDSSNNVYMKQDWSSVEDATLKIELVDQERQQFPGLVGHAELRLCDKVTDQITYFDEDFNIKPLCN